MGSRKKDKEKMRQQREAIAEQKKAEEARLEEEERRRLEAEAALRKKEADERESLRQQFVAAGKKYYLVMYDVRGIQNYVFRTAKIKDAIGGSTLVEKIIDDALRYAAQKVAESGEYKDFTYELEWHSEDGPYRFVDDYKDIKVLFIGGGNAYVLISGKDLAKEINSIMAKYVIEKTYSLQLAVAMVEKTDNYSEDYAKLNSSMIHVKENMIVSKPLGALPILRTEVKTGYPTAYESKYYQEDPDASRETRMKKQAAKEKRRNYEEEEKLLDSFVSEKGEDSVLGFVHIDGNNMGMRIRALVQEKDKYADAVNTMRRISHQINTQYKKTFSEMKDFFEKQSGKYKDYEGKKSKYFVMGVLVAGDDITYVCNGKIALATVEYFCRKISQQAMITVADEKEKQENLDKNGFSVCAGIAYARSHFPFSIAYEVAESCCDSAKKAAKKNLDDGRVGNWVDFTFCKNVQTQNLKKTRQREYMTHANENLLLRPYYVPVGAVSHDGTFDKLVKGQKSLASFERKIEYFQNEKNIPRSQSKDIRNTYSLGETQMKMLSSFLKSRGRTMPDGDDMYVNVDGIKSARYYDALEMMDMYISLDSLKSEENLQKTDEDKVNGQGFGVAQ